MTLQEIEDSLTRSLTTITTHWDAMLAPRSSGSVARGSGASVTLADDHSDTDADTPRLERLLSLRREVTDCLNAWARLIAEDRPVTTALPHGTDTTALAAFILTHTQWFAGHEAAWDAADELRRWAHKIHMAANPTRKDWISIGECPVTIAADGEPIDCGTTVRVYPNHPGDITCRGCGTEDTLDGWILRIVGQSPTMTAEQLVPYLHRRIGLVVTSTAIRQWVTRGMVHVTGKDDAGRNLYDGHAVLRAIKERDERRLGLTADTPA